MTAEVIRLDDYRERRERPDFDADRRAHLKQRVADLAVQIAVFESEKLRLETILKGGEPA